MSAQRAAARAAIAASALLLALSGVALVGVPSDLAGSGDMYADFPTAATGSPHAPATQADAVDIVLTEKTGGAATTDGQTLVRAAPPAGSYPVRRGRRIHMPSWSNGFTSSFRSPLGWLAVLPFALLGVGAAAFPFLLRMRRRKRRRDTGFTGWTDTPTSDADATRQQLTTLSDLHASGLVTDEEFETQRRRITGM
jgi:Short C-terminal domain